MSGIKRTAADKAFSDCIRERVNWTCERCGKYYPPGARAGLDFSHHHSLGNWSIRFEPLNAEALCTGCHFLTGGTQERREEVLTKQQEELLYELKNCLFRGRELRRTKGRGEIAKHYRNEHARMKALRFTGVTKRVEFRGWL